MPTSISNITLKVATSAAWRVFQRIATRGIGIISTLVLVRVLLPADFGLVALATTLAGAIDAMGAMGISFALITARDHDRQLYDTAFTITIIRGLVTGAATAAGAPIA